jgi:hypothetical protein
MKCKFYIRVRPGLDSRLDILEPPFEPIGIRERAFVGVRVVDDRWWVDRKECGDVERLPGWDWETICGGRDVTEDDLVVLDAWGR